LFSAFTGAAGGGVDQAGEQGQGEQGGEQQRHGGTPSQAGLNFAGGVLKCVQLD
jgi:hypothetical protein